MPSRAPPVRALSLAFLLLAVPLTGLIPLADGDSPLPARARPEACKWTSLACPVWSSFRAEGSPSDEPHAVSAAAGGGIVLTTASAFDAGAARFDTLVTAHDGGNGRERWATRIAGSSSALATSSAVAGPGGAVVLVATAVADGFGGGDFAVLGLDGADGRVLWTVKHDSVAGGDGAATRLAWSADGTRALALGRIGGTGAGSDAALVALDAAAGTVLWSAHHDASGRGEDDEGSAVAWSPDGRRAFATAATASGARLLAFDAASGALLWSVPAGGLLLAVASDGKVVYTSHEANRIAAHDAATGKRLWGGHGATRPMAYPAAFALHPDGRFVYVVGPTCTACGSASDVALQAYEARNGDAYFQLSWGSVPNLADVPIAVHVAASGETLHVVATSETPHAPGLPRSEVTVLTYEPVAAGLLQRQTTTEVPGSSEVAVTTAFDAASSRVLVLADAFDPPSLRHGAMTAAFGVAATYKWPGGGN